MFDSFDDEHPLTPFLVQQALVPFIGLLVTLVTAISPIPLGYNIVFVGAAAAYRLRNLRISVLRTGRWVWVFPFAVAAWGFANAVAIYRPTSASPPPWRVWFSLESGTGLELVLITLPTVFTLGYSAGMFYFYRKASRAQATPDGNPPASED